MGEEPWQMGKYEMGTKDRMGESKGRGRRGISGWGCATGTLEPLTYTRASSTEFCYPILE